MRIHINKKGLHLFFAMPLSAMKGKLAHKVISSALQNHNDDDEDSENATPQASEAGSELPAENAVESVAVSDEPDEEPASVTREQIKALYFALKNYVKTNGHFVLLEVRSPEEKVHVKIRI